MKKHIILSLIMLSSFIGTSIAQSEYFYEFSVPGLTTETDATNITNAIKELGVSNLRADHFSGKVLCFSSNSLTLQDFSEKLNTISYYPFFFNSGVQGNSYPSNKTISKWNEANKNGATGKVFIAIASNIFNETQKLSLKNHLESNISGVEVSFSPNNKKAIIHTASHIKRDQLKKFLYGYAQPNKLANLIEIIK